MGGKIFKSVTPIQNSHILPTLEAFAKVIRWHEFFPEKNIHNLLVGSCFAEISNDIDIVIDFKNFYQVLSSQKIFQNDSQLCSDSLDIYNKDFREKLTGFKNSQIIAGKEKKIVCQKGLIKEIIEPRILNFLSRLKFNNSNALESFYNNELESLNNLLDNLLLNEEITKKVENKILRLQNRLQELTEEKEKINSTLALNSFINDDFFAMNGLISFAFPVFSSSDSLFVDPSGKNNFVQIDFMFGDEDWQLKYKTANSDSENIFALRNVLLQTIVSNLTKTSEKRFYFSLLKEFNSDNHNVLGHIQNLIHKSEHHDVLKNELQHQIKEIKQNLNNEVDIDKKIRDTNKKIDELEYENFFSRYISVDANHGIILTTVVFEYKNGKRLVSKYRKDKIKLTNNLEIFIKCLFGDSILVNEISSVEKCLIAFNEKYKQDWFTSHERENVVREFKEYIADNNIEISEWLKINLSL